MSSRRTVLHTGLLICASLLLQGCVTSYMAKLDNIRDRKMPQVERQIASVNRSGSVHLSPGAPTYIRIFKQEKILEVWMKDDESNKYALFKTYPICNFSGYLGPKLKEGDRQAPEGFYSISEEWLWPQSQYHLAMNIGFPNEHDIANGYTGSHLMIHGKCKSDGCYAMGDPGIEEIYLLVENSLLNGNPNVPVHIFPFRMNYENMAANMDSQWTPFWLNIKQGYDLFERNRIPPTVAVRDKKYVFMDYYYARASGAGNGAYRTSALDQ